MDRVRFGIVGVGTQGGTYARFLTDEKTRPEGCALGALADVSDDRAARCRSTYSEVPFFTDWRELVASDAIDAVIVCVPHYLHPEVAMFCLQRGVPVVVEKPAGVYAKQVREMNECAAAHPDVPFAIMFNQRTNKLYQWVRAHATSGELGAIRRSSWMINTWWRPDSYYRQSEWRATWGGEGGGVLVNQAPHQLDLWQWICGMPVKAFAKIRFGAHRDIVVDNDVTLVVEYANGATGTFITATHDPVGTDRLEIDFDRGKIVVDRSERATLWRLNDDESVLNETMDMVQLARLTSSNEASNLYTEEVFEHRDQWGKQHMKVMEDFASHLINGTPLLAPGVEGIHGVNLANAALLSSWLGHEVAVPVDEELFVRELNKRIETEGKYPTR